MSKPRICLTTHFDENYRAIGELCLLSLRRYGKEYGYDVVTVPEARSGRPPSWDKILVIQELFKRGYEYVLWVDADAVIVRYDRDIAKEIKPDKNLYMVLFHFLQGGEALNFGVFLIRNNDWSKKMLDRLWAMREYSFHPWWENSALLDMLKTAHLLPENPPSVNLLMPQAYDTPSNYAMLSKISVIGPQWNHCPYLDTYAISCHDSVIRHYAALSKPMREYRMTGDLVRAGLLHHKHLLITFFKILKGYWKEKKELFFYRYTSIKNILRGIFVIE